MRQPVTTTTRGSTIRQVALEYDPIAEVWVDPPGEKVPISLETDRGDGHTGYDHMTPEQARNLALVLLAAAFQAEDHAAQSPEAGK